MPKLIGGSAYSRPPVKAYKPVQRPFDPDDLPLEAERTSEDLEAVTKALAQVNRNQDAAAAEGQGRSGGLLGRPFRLHLPGRGKEPR